MGVSGCLDRFFRPPLVRTSVWPWSIHIVEARAVVAKLTRRNTTTPVAVLTKDTAAYDAYLRGRAAMARW